MQHVSVNLQPSLLMLDLLVYLMTLSLPSDGYNVTILGMIWHNWLAAHIAQYAQCPWLEI